MARISLVRPWELRATASPVCRLGLADAPVPVATTVGVGWMTVTAVTVLTSPLDKVVVLWYVDVNGVSLLVVVEELVSMVADVEKVVCSVDDDDEAIDVVCVLLDDGEVTGAVLVDVVVVLVGAVVWDSVLVLVLVLVLDEDADVWLDFIDVGDD